MILNTSGRFGIGGGLAVHRALAEVPAAAYGCVLAIGNFDGVHPGHAALIAQAREIARAAGAPLGVMTFEPHPKSFFQPDAPPFRLTLAAGKARRLAALGVDHLFALPFDAAFAELGAETFVAGVLQEALRVSHVVVGPDFHFGRGRKGGPALLRQAEEEGRFRLTLVEQVLCAGAEVYSSTRIRACLAVGDLRRAAFLMGQPFEFEGEVVRGDQRGRTIGYPTANQKVTDYLRIPYGIYAVEVQIEGEEVWRPGVASYGLRPMFKLDEPLLETYIFDFDEEIYGKTLRVRPAAFIRGEKAFDGLEALKAGIAQDCLAARAMLKSRPLDPL